MVGGFGFAVVAGGFGFTVVVGEAVVTDGGAAVVAGGAVGFGPIKRDNRAKYEIVVKRKVAHTVNIIKLNFSSIEELSILTTCVVQKFC